MPISSKKRSGKQERTIAEQIGGSTTPGSGAGWAVKNDVKNDRISIEAKYTDKGSYSLKLADLLKAERHALTDSGREFGFVVEIQGHSFFITSWAFGQELLSGHSE